jgi:hypothetical protein
MEGLIFFPLKILKRRRTAANFSLNKDGGVFNGTMFDSVTKYICRTEYMRVIFFLLRKYKIPRRCQKSTLILTASR